MYRISEEEYKNLPQECQGMHENHRAMFIHNEELVEGVHFVFASKGDKYVKLRNCEVCGRPSVIYSRNLCHACYERVRRQRQDRTWEEKIAEQRMRPKKRKELSTSTNSGDLQYPLNILHELRMLGDDLPDQPDTWYQTALPQVIEFYLSDSRRNILKMRFQYNMSIREIRQQRGCSRQNVYILLTSALRFLYRVVAGCAPGSFAAISLPAQYMDDSVSCLAVNQKLIQKLEDAGIHTIRQVLYLVNKYRYNERDNSDFRSSAINKYRMALKTLAASDKR